MRSRAGLRVQPKRHWCARVDSAKLRRMDWMPLLSTLAGAGIGVSAALVADRNR